MVSSVPVSVTVNPARGTTQLHTIRGDRFEKQQQRRFVYENPAFVEKFYTRSTILFVDIITDIIQLYCSLA